MKEKWSTRRRGRSTDGGWQCGMHEIEDLFTEENLPPSSYTAHWLPGDNYDCRSSDDYGCR